MSSEEFTAINDRLDRIERLAAIQTKPILDSKEAAVFTGFSIKHLYLLTSTKQIPHYKKNAKLLFKKSELESWLTAQKAMTIDEVNQRATTYTATHKSHSV